MSNKKPNHMILEEILEILTWYAYSRINNFLIADGRATLASNQALSLGTKYVNFLVVSFSILLKL